MGTRADFYIGRGASAQWLGSIAFDGYPEGLVPQQNRAGIPPEDNPLFKASTEDEFRMALAEYFKGRGDLTTPDMGWPWPWDDSRTTDYAYAFDGGKVFASIFGSEWFEPRLGTPDQKLPKTAVFPNMKTMQKVTLGPRSGLIVIQRGKI